MLEAAKRVGSTSGGMSLYRHGKVNPPLKKLPAWADALGLEGQEREDFIVLGHLAHAPEQIERSFLAMLKEVGELRAEVADMRALVRKLAREDNP